MSRYRLAVLGNPVAHSWSPVIYEQFGRQTGLSLSYEKVLVPEEAFDRVASQFLESGFGFNITLPCKRDAWRFVDEASEVANQAQSVNTISRTAGGKLRGDNTDGPGLVNDLLRNLGWQIKGRKVLVVGAGGAVSGVMANLLAEEPAMLHVFNRTPEKARELQENHAGVIAVTSDSLHPGYDLVINGTSAGLSDQDVEIPGSVIRDGTRCYDMIYGPGTTRFNAWCLEQRACEVADGLGMLVEQAALAFRIWFGTQIHVTPSTKPVIETIRNTLD